MAEIRAFCPDCGSIDLIALPETVSLGVAPVKCPNCGWSGTRADTVGAATTEQFWDIGRVGNVMIRTMAIHGAGPLVQCLEFIGLLPKKKDTAGLDGAELHKARSWNASAQKARDRVMGRVMELTISTMFEEAEQAHRVFAVEQDIALHPMIQDTTAGDKVFGGNVLPMRKPKRRKKGKR